MSRLCSLAFLPAQTSDFPQTASKVIFKNHLSVEVYSFHFDDLCIFYFYYFLCSYVFKHITILTCNAIHNIECINILVQYINILNVVKCIKILGTVYFCLHEKISFPQPRQNLKQKHIFKMKSVNFSEISTISRSSHRGKVNVQKSFVWFNLSEL